MQVSAREGASWCQNNFKGKSRGQGQDRGAKHGRDKGMLEVQDNNQTNFDVQCSRGARQCEDEVRGVWYVSHCLAQ